MWLTNLLPLQGHISVKLRGQAHRARREAASRYHNGAIGALFAGVPQAFAQQANQPGFDPRQTEKYFENQTERESLSRPPVRLPTVDQPNTGGDTKPQFVLRGINVSGARAISPDRIAAVYQPYVGRKVSQADLAAIAGAISDLYRADGFHLSRAIVPPQDIADGLLRIQVIEGAIVQAELKGDGAEQFGVRPMLGPVLAEQPSRLATLERQLFLINGRPGVRITDTALEEIGGATGRFRLIVYLKTWHVFSSFGLDNLGSSSVGPWQTYATGAFNSYLKPGDTLAVNLSTIANDPRQLGFARLSYDAPVGVEGVRLGGSVLYSAVRPGDARRLDSDITTTEAFELRASIVPLQSQLSSLTLTAATTFSNVSEHDLYGAWYNDHIRTASLTADYRLQDHFGGTNFATLTFRQGLDIFGASHFDDDLLSRDGASSNFSVLNLWFTRYQTLNDVWSLKFPVRARRRHGRCSPRSNSISAALPSGAAMAQQRSAVTTVLPAHSNCASTRSSISATGPAISSMPSVTPEQSGTTVTA